MGIKDRDRVSMEILEPCSLQDYDLEQLKQEMDTAEDVFYSRNKLDHNGRRTNEPRTKPESNKWDKFV